MPTVNVHEAKTQLSRWLQAVEAGEEVVIARAGQPMASLVSLVPAVPRRRFGASACSPADTPSLPISMPRCRKTHWPCSRAVDAGSA